MQNRVNAVTVVLCVITSDAVWAANPVVPDVGMADPLFQVKAVQPCVLVAA